MSRLKTQREGGREGERERERERKADPALELSSLRLEKQTQNQKTQFSAILTESREIGSVKDEQ